MNYLQLDSAQLLLELSINPKVSYIKIDLLHVSTELTFVYYYYQYIPTTHELAYFNGSIESPSDHQYKQKEIPNSTQKTQSILT